MAKATGMICVGFQPDSELKFDLTCTEGERPSSYAQLTNPTDRPMHFVVEATDLVHYEVKPTRGIVKPFETYRINVIACGLPRDEQWEGEIQVVTWYSQEDQVCLFFLEKDYHPPLRHRAVSESVIRVRWVNPEKEIPNLMSKAAEEVCRQNLGSAREAIREAIDLRPDSYSLLCRALVNHRLGQKEEANRDLQEAVRLFSMSELAERTGESFAFSVTCLNTISDNFGVPTFTREKLCAKQMVVNWNESVTENQRLVVEVRLAPSIMLRPEGPYVEVIVNVDSVRFEVVRDPSEDTDSYPGYFLQSLKIVVCPTGEWSESFSKPLCGLIKWTPGNELNPEIVQRGRSRGYAAGVNLGASPAAGLQWNGNRTSGTSFPCHGFHKSARDGHAYVCEDKLRTFKDGSCAENLDGKRFFKVPDIPEAAKGENNHNLSDFAGTWVVPYATAVGLRDEIEFTVSVEAKLAAVRRMKNLTHLWSPPKPLLEERKMEARRTCAFAIARLQSFIEKGM